ncbi:MAG TPA: glycosyltransferase family 4 protein [Pyrinomonadaceae bacterium]|nr:glycosyltransferase family 4 protein [Pyrinomonadaceae bacterium]
MVEQTKERAVSRWGADAGLRAEARESVGRGGAGMDADAARRAPLRVLIIAPSHDILGGQSIHAAQLVRELSKEPTLRVSFLPINPRAPGVLRRLQKIKYVRTVVTSFIYLAKLLARVPRYDVIHVSSAADTGFVLATTPPVVVGKLFGKRVVLNYHAGQAEEHLRDWGRTAKPVIRMADATVVSSGWLVDVFARHGLKARAIFNHVELEALRFRERRRLRPAFLSNRNFDPIYNVPCVLRAFALIQKRYADARMTVAGDGAQRAEVERVARELELRNVEFTGLLAPGEMPRLCDAADIYLNASNVDNMPLSILEAFAAGLPVVTTNAGGIPYIVEQGRTGLLVEKNDHEAMAAAALRLLEDEDLASRLALAARAECDKYEWAAVRGQWLDFYEEVAGREEAVAP